MNYVVPILIVGIISSLMIDMALDVKDLRRTGDYARILIFVLGALAALNTKFLIKRKKGLERWRAKKAAEASSKRYMVIGFSGIFLGFILHGIFL